MRIHRTILAAAFASTFCSAIAIDPARIWATYYGGSTEDDGFSCAVDAAGNVYLAGYTRSTTFIASGGHQLTHGGGNTDAFLAKFDANGTRLWATYYGGTANDYAYSCAVDADGNVFLAGSTISSNAIASNGHQNAWAGGGAYDAFLVKFNASGTRLWGTYYGGTGGETANACTVDVSGNVYLTGWTYSSTAISSAGHQAAYGGSGDAFLVKFNAAGTRLWGTYYGGTGVDYGYSCSVNNDGQVHLAGETTSTTAMASGGYQNAQGAGNDAFLVKFDANGTRLWGTYYGGSGEDHGRSCAVDATGNIFLSGYTTSLAGIASGGHQNVHGGSATDAFLVKFNASGSRLWGTYYGGSSGDFANACATSPDGSVFLTGHSSSTNAIASGGYQNTIGGATDAFLVKFSTSGVRSWGTYYGGSGVDLSWSCALDAGGQIYLAGQTGSTQAIADGGHQNTQGGSGDAFLAKFLESGSTGARLSVRAFLDGAYDTGSGLMTDALRVQGLVPVQEPYSALGFTQVGGGGEQTSAAVLAVQGGNAIVDWVLIELRDATIPAVRLATRCALLQRDGDVVEVDGVSPVLLATAPGNYHVAVRHRNHLGVMTASPMNLSSVPTVLDFTNPATQTWGTNAQKSVNGTMVLWPGDANFNGTVKYAGSTNDRDPILTNVGGTVPTATVTNAYNPSDVNLDGTIKYAGAANDRDFILQTIGGAVPTAIRVQQLP